MKASTIESSRPTSAACRGRRPSSMCCSRAIAAMPHDASSAAAHDRAAPSVMWCEGRWRAGVDVVSDGEMSKISYATYIKDRLTGFAGDTPREPGQDLVDFPRILKTAGRPGCDREVHAAALRRARSSVKSLEPMRTDVDEHAGGAVAAATPTRRIPERRLAWRHRAVSAERLLQDAGRLSGGGRRRRCVRSTRRSSPPACWCRSTRRTSRWAGTRCIATAAWRTFSSRAAVHIEVLNHALRNVPADRVRMHVCWGNYEGPHHHDVPLELLLAGHRQGEACRAC